MLKLCGNYIGEGCRRIIYQHKEDPSLVIKFLKKPTGDHNQIEFDNWQRFKDTERRDWLIPCVSISDDGRFLIQKKAGIFYGLPENLPTWITELDDYKEGGNQSPQWGTYEGRVVLIDYGLKNL